MAEARGPRIGGSLAVGLAAIGVFFVGFGGWAAIAPIERAVVAAGVVGVESERKTVQHLEGGIVRKIFVRDGDRVAAGQVLIDLDDTQSGATLDLLRMRRDTAAARQARLEAERGGRDAIDFPAELLARRTDPAVAEVLATQADLFRVRRQALDGQVAIQEARVAQLRSEIVGLEGAIAAEAPRRPAW